LGVLYAHEERAIDVPLLDGDLVLVRVALAEGAA